MATSPMNSRENEGLRPVEKAWLSGSQPRVTPNRYRAPMASQKYGNDPTKISSGGKTESRNFAAPPRCQDAEEVAQDDGNNQGGAAEQEGPADL